MARGESFAAVLSKNFLIVHIERLKRLIGMTAKNAQPDSFHLHILLTYNKLRKLHKNRIFADKKIQR